MQVLLCKKIPYLFPFINLKSLFYCFQFLHNEIILLYNSTVITFCIINIKSLLPVGVMNATDGARLAQTIGSVSTFPQPFPDNSKFRKTPGGGPENIQRADVTPDHTKRLSKQRAVHTGLDSKSPKETTGVVTARWIASRDNPVELDSPVQNEEPFIFALKVVPITDEKSYIPPSKYVALSNKHTQINKENVGLVNQPLRAPEQPSVESIRGQFSKTSPPSDKEADGETVVKNGPDNTTDKEPLYLVAHWYRELAFYKKGYTHPHLLFLHGYSYVPRSIHFYLEIMECSLRELGKIYKTSLFKTGDGPVKKQAFCAYLKHVLSGLSFIHEWTLMHRDIKDSNTLVKINEGKVVIKLSDFGTVKVNTTLCRHLPR